MNRPLTQQERDWLKQGLATLTTGTYDFGGSVESEPLDPLPYLDQLDSLRVCSMCNCGTPACHTVTFQHAQRGRQATLVVSDTDDGRMLIIMVDKDSNLLAELEII